MDKLKSLQVFIDIVEQNSITHAAYSNQISATMAGKHLKSLEAELKQTLLTRTTRKLSLTEAGKLYYQSAKHIQQTLLNTENQLQQMQQKPSGNIKLNAPVTFSEVVLAPLIPQFLRRYPEINIELICENRITDPMHDSSDLLIRIGELENSNLYAQKLGEYQMVFAASPSYINRYDVPTSINDLNLHQCLGFIPNRMGIQQMTTNSMPLQTNSGRVLLSAALAGSGIILQPKILIENALTEGALIQILNDEHPKAKSIHIIYKNKPLPLKCKAFIKFLKANYK
ncbi:LysR family transcriptional regulator [Shewanella sp. 202IG2-18]|uniref:LysR family transcriptional regulator n=1 Tax=Parashewanella hymeniacidonis TaxID=2807618 RepID=UPI00195FDB80|nr:LysR family transcriptional regulator [Parashewanella hymeniacidonis]MBM7071855.1 LysR family transcriptional regulator [Parashewanella hymeniacidonis]